MNSSPQSISEIKWYLPADYAKVHPKRNGVVALAITRIKDDNSVIAEGLMWTDSDGTLQWNIRSINGTPFAVFETGYGLTQGDYRLDYWADTLQHPRYTQ